MSFLSGLFGGGTKRPTATPPPPRIGDIAGEAAAREQRYRSKRKFGVDDTILTGTAPLGTPSVSTPRRSSLLGG